VSYLLSFVLAWASVAAPCRDSRQQSAVIGGDVIRATAVSSAGKLLRYAPVHLYFDDKLVWTGTTDKNGTFTINQLQPGKYRLAVVGWGSAALELNPKLDGLSNHQLHSYSLMLSNRSCVAAIDVVE
jgi:hypothetical protein